MGPTTRDQMQIRFCPVILPSLRAEQSIHCTYGGVPKSTDQLISTFGLHLHTILQVSTSCDWFIPVVSTPDIHCRTSPQLLVLSKRMALDPASNLLELSEIDDVELSTSQRVINHVRKIVFKLTLKMMQWLRVAP